LYNNQDDFQRQSSLSQAVRAEDGEQQYRRARCLAF
jgi:hypothetical protein